MRGYSFSGLPQSSDVPSLRDEAEVVRGQKLDAFVTLVISHVRVLEAEDERLDGLEVNRPDYLVIVSFGVDLNQVTPLDAVLLQQARNRYATDAHAGDLVRGHSVLEQVRPEERSLSGRAARGCIEIPRGIRIRNGRVDGQDLGMVSIVPLQGLK